MSTGKRPTPALSRLDLGEGAREKWRTSVPVVQCVESVGGLGRPDVQLGIRVPLGRT